VPCELALCRRYIEFSIIVTFLIAGWVVREGTVPSQSVLNYNGFRSLHTMFSQKETSELDYTISNRFRVFSRRRTFAKCSMCATRLLSLRRKTDEYQVN